MQYFQNHNQINKVVNAVRITRQSINSQKRRKTVVRVVNVDKKREHVSDSRWNQINFSLLKLRHVRSKKYIA